MRSRARLLWMVVPLLLAVWVWRQWWVPPPTRVLADGSRLAWGGCPGGLHWQPLFCGRLQRPAGGRGQALSLAVVYLRSLWPWARPPVLYIAGGPGGATGLDAAGLPLWLDWYAQVDWQADLVLYDQRGVGLSRPALDCPEVRRVRQELLDSDLPAEAQYRRQRQAQQACLRRLRAQGARLTRYHTPANTDDALALVAALGLTRWRLYGVSYGTRVGLEILRRHPAGLEGAVLDSVYPPQMQAEREDAWLLAHALGMFERSCELIDCDDSRARLAGDLRRALRRLARHPQRVALEDAPAPAVRLDDDDLAWLVFESQYQWDNLPRLPGAVRGLAHGRVTPALRELLRQSVESAFDDSLSDAVANSVDCSDNGPLDEAAFLRTLRQFPRVAAIKRLDWRYSPCRFWPRGPVPAAFRAPVRSAIPVLLLSGEFDPVTPPEWAEAAAAPLERGHLFIFPAIGHGVLDSDACAVRLVRAFWADPAVPRPPACLDALYEPPSP